MLGALAFPLLSLPRIKLPDWAWGVLLVALALLGLTLHLEKAARDRARAAFQERENRRIAEALEARARMEADFAKDWSSRPRDRDALVDVLRDGAF